MAKPLTPARIISEILAGHHDDVLTDLFEATSTRIVAAKLTTRWKVKDFDGLSFTEDDLTLDEIADIEDLCNVPWSAFRPVDTAREARALLTVILQSRKGMSEAGAKERIRSLPAIEASDLFSIYTPERSPLDPPDPS